MASFTITVRQRTEMFQWAKCFSEKKQSTRYSS